MKRHKWVRPKNKREKANVPIKSICLFSKNMRIPKESPKFVTLEEFKNME